MGKQGRGWTLRLAGLLSPVTIWLGLFFLVPLLLILAYSFGKSGIYGGITLGFYPGNYLKVFDPLYLEIIVRTLVIALIESFNNGLTWATPGSDWTQSIIFAILIIILVFRPQGLLGEEVPEGA